MTALGRCGCFGIKGRRERVGICRPRHGTAAITLRDDDDGGDADDDDAGPCMRHGTLVTVSLGCHTGAAAWLDSVAEKDDA